MGPRSRMQIEIGAVGIPVVAKDRDWMKWPSKNLAMRKEKLKKKLKQITWKQQKYKHTIFSILTSTNVSIEENSQQFAKADF